MFTMPYFKGVDRINVCYQWSLRANTISYRCALDVRNRKFACWLNKAAQRCENSVISITFTQLNLLERWEICYWEICDVRRIRCAWGFVVLQQTGNELVCAIDAQEIL